MTYHGRCRVLDTTLDYGLIAVLIWTPLAFGIVYPCAYSLMEIHIFLLIAAWMARLMVGRCLPDACQAIAVPAFGEQARTLAPVQALLLACVHRVAHHDNSERLIWLYDIHLLASGMTRDELATFIQLTAERRLRVVCSSSLQLAQHRFTTSLPADFMPALHVLLGDLRALSGWQNKICLLKEHLLPPSAYLREHYATANRVWLPLLYVQRAIRGGWKLRLRTGSPPSSSGCHRCRRKA